MGGGTGLGVCTEWGLLALKNKHLLGWLRLFLFLDLERKIVENCASSFQQRAAVRGAAHTVPGGGGRRPRGPPAPPRLGDKGAIRGHDLHSSVPSGSKCPRPFAQIP